MKPNKFKPTYVAVVNNLNPEPCYDHKKADEVHRELYAAFLMAVKRVKSEKGK